MVPKEKWLYYQLKGSALDTTVRSLLVYITSHLERCISLAHCKRQCLDEYRVAVPETSQAFQRWKFTGPLTRTPKTERLGQTVDMYKLVLGCAVIRPASVDARGPKQHLECHH